MQSFTQGSQSYDPAVKTEAHFPPTPSSTGTICLLAGIAIAYTLFPAESSPQDMASAAAVPVGVGFAVSACFDSQRGMRNLLRTDLLCLFGIYSLTLLEFLFPQEEFYKMATSEETGLALNIVLTGMAAMAIGRHLVKPTPVSSRLLKLEDISNKALFNIFCISALLGYLYKLLAVEFDVIAMVDAMLGARFTQPWGRERLGGWSSLFIELSLMIYVVPPLAAIIWSRRRSYGKPQVLVAILIFGLVLFEGFAGGTRNIFITYLATFLMAYLLTLPKNTIVNTVFPIILTGVISVYGSYHMLEFRNMGLRNYIVNREYVSESTRDTLHVDYNLASIGWIAAAVPKNHDFLGLEIITWSLVRPIPRVFWPGKPEGLSVSIEEIAGADGWTVAATYLGESYMMAGMVGVIVMSLLFGAMAAWWNRMAARQQSDYALVVYALGFFAAGITMRSMFWLTTTILPVLALIAFRKLMSAR